MQLEIPGFVGFIIKRLNQSGHQAYLVGGAVRNAVLKQPVIDWDIATSASRGEIRKAFSDTRLFALKQGTVTLVDSTGHFEVTAFRGEKNCLEDDLARRDFTINAMAYDMENGELIDLFGGIADIELKRVRAVGDPAIRFREDPVRLMRAVRFAVELGFGMESDTLETLINLSPIIDLAAPERIRQEFMKVLMLRKPSSGLNLMARTGLLEYFLPEILEGRRKRQNDFHRYTIFRHAMETMDRTDPVPLLRLSALFHDIAKPRVRKKVDGKWRFHGHERASADLAEEIMERLRFSREMIRKVQNLILHHMIDYAPAWSDAAVRRLIRRSGPESINDLIMLRRADLLAHGPGNKEANLLEDLEVRIREQLRRGMATETKDLAIDGREVMEVLGIAPGPMVGKILKELMEKVIEDPELNDRARLTAILERSLSP